jgi:hypothetical protein
VWEPPTLGAPDLRAWLDAATTATLVADIIQWPAARAGE